VSRKRADHALRPPVIANRLADGVDSRRQRRIGDDPALPDGVEQLVLAHYTVTMPEQIEQDVENLGLELDLDASAAQLATAHIQCEFLKKVDEVVHPSALFPSQFIMCAGVSGKSRPPMPAAGALIPTAADIWRGPVADRAQQNAFTVLLSSIIGRDSNCWWRRRSIVRLAPASGHGRSTAMSGMGHERTSPLTMAGLSGGIHGIAAGERRWLITLWPE